MKKTLLYSIIALTLVVGLILPMAVPVMASEITGTKVRNPDLAPYQVGENIHFVMSVTNPGNNTNTNTLTRIWDTLPSGTVIDFLGTNETLVQIPGNTTTFSADYVVRAQDIIWIATLSDYGVQNKFEAEGYDSPAGDDVYVLVTSNTRVLETPPVGGEAFPIGKLSILAPWIAMGAAIAVGAATFARRRRHVRS
jgi:uncharacterized repeat protein (TIGR01451 family)